MKNLNIKKIILAGLAIFFISFLIGGGSYFLFGRVFELEPTSIWKWTPAQGLNMPAEWWIILYLLNIVLAIIFAFVFSLIEKGLPGKGIQRGLAFGIIVWIVGPIPALVTMYLMINIATGALVYFALQSLFEWLIYGSVISFIYKDEKNSRGTKARFTL
jgi:predicted tellurium resistance membrane protein TerC